jgi:hypothetical protein
LGEGNWQEGKAMSRQLAFSVTVHDCEVQTFRSGGKGGQNQNKRDTGVRVIHHPSGARGESREERSQLQNKQAAFRRMSESAAFRYWARLRLGNIESEDAWVARQMEPTNLLTEVRENGRWMPRSPDLLID